MIIIFKIYIDGCSFMVFSGKKRNGDTLSRDTKTKTPKATTEKEFLLKLRSERQRYKKCDEKRSYNLKVKATKAKYYMDNKERIKAKVTQYNEDNKELMNNQKKAFYEKNKDKKKAHMKLHYEKNKDEKKSYYQKNKDEKKSYYEKNKDQKKAYRIDYYKKKHCNHPSQYICKKRQNNSGASPNCSAGKGWSSKYTSSANCADDFYLINDGSTPEEIRNCLFQDLNENLNVKNLRDISSSLSESIKYDSNKHEYTAQSNICVVCDELIIGLEPLKVLLTDDIVRNRDRISIDSFESHYRVELSDDLRSQYQIDDEALYGLLLSPRARKFEKPRPSYTCCCKCHKSMTSPTKEDKINPPKFAIANGFVIGHIPRNKLTYQDANNEDMDLPQDFDPDKHLDDLICAAISPVRPYG